MKSVYLYNSNHRGFEGHPIHEAWAKSINAESILDRDEMQVPYISRFIKSLFTSMKIPKDADLVLCEGASQIFSGYFWKRKNKDKKIVLIVSDPKWFYLKKTNFLLKKIYTKALKDFDLFISTSPLMKSLIPKELPGKVSMVFPFFDNRFAEYKCDLSKKNIVFTGRVGWEKGVDILFKAYKKILKDFPESRLYILGFGNLMEQLKKENIENMIFTGWEHNPENYLKKSSVYMSLARIDPAGVAVLEAMSMGVVPVVSEGVGYNYVVKKISKELVVKNPDEASIIVKKLWNDRKLLDKYSKKAREISKDYNKEKSLRLFKKAISLIQS